MVFILISTLIVVLLSTSYVDGKWGLKDGKLINLPVVINTWNFTAANARAWVELAAKGSALDAVEFGCSQCEIDQCDGTVGYGGSPSETGETTLDAMIMDGESYKVGGVAGLRRVKNAISVARLVLERTKHSLLVGEMATQFAVSLGFKEESLSTNQSLEIHQKWLEGNCQPNFWQNVSPDPTRNCGPYHKFNEDDYNPSFEDYELLGNHLRGPHIGHDTIGMIALDSQNRMAAGTSTNGARYKILGRVGDSPIAGAGAYVAGEAGGAAATGDGDVIMRHLLSYQAVENLRRGMKPDEAAKDSIKRLVERTKRPHPMVGVIVLSKDGQFGAACCGMERFPFVVSNSRGRVQTQLINCIN